MWPKTKNIYFLTLYQKHLLALLQSNLLVWQVKKFVLREREREKWLRVTHSNRNKIAEC